MYMLYHMYVSNRKWAVQDKMFEETESILSMVNEKLYIREQFMKIFDQYVIGMVTPEMLKESVIKMSELITSDELRTWFLADVNKILDDDRSYVKSKNKLQMREARARGLSVVGGENAD